MPRSALPVAKGRFALVVIRSLLTLVAMLSIVALYGLTVKLLFWNGANDDNGQEIALALRLGADPKDSSDGLSALTWAVQAGRVNAVRSLLCAGADPNDTYPIIDGNASTVLMDAVSESRTEIVKLLLEQGADPNRRNINGYTALLIATKNKDSNLVDLLRRFHAQE